MQKRTWKTYLYNTRYPENYERKEKKKNKKGFCAKNMSEEKNEKCLSDMSREKRCSSSMVYDN